MNEFCRCLPETCALTVANLVTRDSPLLVKGASVPAYLFFTIGEDSYYIGFSEVYWQPITKGYLAAHNGQTPVPVFTWAHSLNCRVRGDDRGGQSLSAWREALDNAETLLGLIQKLAVISGKAKTFGQTLCDFIGDVQMYAEVDPIHDDVNVVFKDALDDIAFTRKQIPAVFDSSEIYIVAHSEGTVVSWKSLILARSAEVPPGWLNQIKGFVTLGSPIDKHLLMWGPQNFPPDISTEQANKIRWWNFWDYSDPVGHSLDGVFHNSGAPVNKQFERVYDAGFARYPIPGVAHVDYWADANIYHRIIQEVMGIPAGYATWQMDTGSRWWGQWWFMRAGDLLSYGLGRAAEAGAMVYFLYRLTTQVRDWLLVQVPALALAKTWPTRSLWLNAAIWVWASAALWKFLWDGLLSGFQDRVLNLEAQFRVERAALFVWGVIMLVAALSIEIPASCPAECPTPTLKTYFAWAVGLLVTIILFKVHTIVNKGLIQLWRYGRGGTAFKPSAGVSASVAVGPR
jgi:hypothetical protein